MLSTLTTNEATEFSLDTEYWKAHAENFVRAVQSIMPDGAVVRGWTEHMELIVELPELAAVIHGCPCTIKQGFGFAYDIATDMNSGEISLGSEPLDEMFPYMGVSVHVI